MSETRFGQRVRAGREALNLTREEFAAAVGTSTATMARIELADHRPSVDVILAIARTIGTTVEELVGERAA